MPELPEVETIVRALHPRLSGRRIVRADFFSALILRHCRAPLAESLTGRTILSVERCGKFILAPLDHGSLLIHLGMTGKLLFDAPPGPHTRAMLTLDSGTLAYEDIRMFGSLEWHEGAPPRLAGLGPEPLEIAPVVFAAALRARRSPVKAVLLNQAVVRGVGNIYADEALFRASIHPRTRSHRLGVGRACRLHAALVEVLLDAIEHRGSSISDYVDADNRRGSFQAQHRVYGRQDQPCRACGAVIRRIVVAQRGTHYCPRCQR